MNDLGLIQLSVPLRFLLSLHALTLYCLSRDNSFVEKTLISRRQNIMRDRLCILQLELLLLWDHTIVLLKYEH